MLLNPYRFGVYVPPSPVSLLLHLDGANNDTSSTDSSLSPKTLTFNGTSKLSTAQYKFGTTSLKFDGSADCNVTIPDNNAFEMGAGDYTLSLWAYFNNTSGGGIFMKGKYYGYFAWDAGFGIRSLGNNIRFYFNTTNSGSSEKYLDSPSASISINTWTHLEMCVQAGTGYCFINGTLIGSLSSIGSIPESPIGIILGRFPFNDAVIAFNGYIDEIQLLKGVALHTANFTPPTVPYDNP